MSIERKQFLVWLTIMAVFVASIEALLQTHPELFGAERPGIYRQLPVVKAFHGPRCGNPLQDLTCRGERMIRQLTRLGRPAEIATQMHQKSMWLLVDCYIGRLSWSAFHDLRTYMPLL